MQGPATLAKSTNVVIRRAGPTRFWSMASIHDAPNVFQGGDRGSGVLRPVDPFVGWPGRSGGRMCIEADSEHAPTFTNPPCGHILPRYRIPAMQKPKKTPPDGSPSGVFCISTGERGGSAVHEVPRSSRIIPRRAFCGPGRSRRQDRSRRGQRVPATGRTYRRS